MAIATIRKAFFLQLLLSLFLVSSLSAQDQNIGGTLTGEPLLDYLRDNYTPNSTLGYNTARDRMYTILDNFDGIVICVYTYYERAVDPNSSTPRADAYNNGQDINAEHIWPQSMGAGSEPAKSDLHHLYASEIQVNADRGNLRFGNIDDAQVTEWYNNDVIQSAAPPFAERDNWSKRKSGDRFEAKLDRKGDIARAVFYFYTIYNTVASDAFFNSMYEDMLTWHDADEVDTYEVWRTGKIEEWQGNVNPFVMDTTLVRRAYFSGDGGDVGDPEPEPDTDLVFYESFSAPASGTDVSVYTFDNDGVLGYEATGSTDVRSTTSSTGYEGASGGALIFMNDGSTSFTITGINTSDYEEISLSFGAHANTSTDAFNIAYSTNNGGDWNEVVHSLSNFTTSWALYSIENTGIPSHENVSLRFSKNNTSMYRLDDIRMTGVVPVSTPEVNASNLLVDNITSSSAQINWTAGDGSSRLVIMRENSAVTAEPVDDISYTANSEFGVGQEIATGEFVVYKGTGNQVSVAGLNPETNYYFTVIEFNGGTGEEKYLNTGAPSSDFLTNAAPTGPEVIFYESFGSPTSNTSVSAYTFDNDGVLGFEATGSTDVRTSLSSEGGYEGASGEGLIFMNTGSTSFTITGINTSDYNDISISFGAHTNTNVDAFTIEYSTNSGVDWNEVVHSLPDFNSNWALYAIEDTGIPSHENVSLRFSKDNIREYRLDDITLTGIVSSDETYSFTVTGNDGWRMLSLPIGGISAGDLAAQNSIQGITGSFDDAAPANFYSSYDGNSWVLPNDMSDVITSGNGFIWYFFNNDIGESKSLPFDISVTGESPSEEFDVSLNETGDKWTLLGNPFPDAIEFENVSNNIIGGSLASNNYAVWDGSSYESLTLGIDQVEPFHAFLIQNNDATSFRFFPDDRITMNASPSQVEYRAISFSLIEKSDREHPLIDKDAKILFHDDAHEGWDNYDFTKLRSLNDSYVAVALVENSNNQAKLKSIDSYHYDLQEELVIPIYLESQNFSGTAELHLNDLVNIPNNWQIKIRDRKSGALESLPLEIDMADFNYNKSATTGLELKPADNANFRYDLLISPSEITSVLPDDNLPSEITLRQNYPNPFNPTTTISFALPEEQMVTLRIFDMLGREVAVLMNEVRSAGNHQITWDATSASSGMYMYQIETNSRTLTRKMTLIK